MKAQAPRTAMYLAAGLGERMRPLTDHRPKPLVALAGRALMDYALDQLCAAGVTRVVVNLHYLGGMIREHLHDCRQPEIIFSDESAQLLGAGGGVLKALPLLGDAPFFVHNCDSFWRDPAAEVLRAMTGAFDAERMDALLLVAPLERASGFDGPGDYFMAANQKLRRNREKSLAAPYAFAGVYIAHPRLFEGAPRRPFSTVELWDRAEAAGRLAGFTHPGRWFHTGTPEALAIAEAELQHGQR